MQDIGALWERFFSAQIADKIPNRIDGDILSVYYHYQGDDSQPYDNLIGCRVSSLNSIPDGLTGVTVVGGKYREFTATGDVTQGAVGKAWEKIWATDIDRAYQTDYEIYGEKAQNPQDAEVPIFIGINEK